MVYNIDSSFWGYSYPSDLTIYNDTLYFSADNGINGMELWKYDGINDPSMVCDIYPGDYPFGPYDFTVFNNLYFCVSDGIHGFELWVYHTNNSITNIENFPNNNDASIIVYPNPTTKNFSIKFDKSYNNITLM